MKKGKKGNICNNIEIFGNVVVGTKGQIVIPHEVRKILEIETGDTMIITLKHKKAIGLIKSTDLKAFLEIMEEEITKIKTDKILNHKKRK